MRRPERECQIETLISRYLLRAMGIDRYKKGEMRERIERNGRVSIELAVCRAENMGLAKFGSARL
ncbi:hypothetical protein TorRG33x02_357170, partial [Trema orientale]